MAHIGLSLQRAMKEVAEYSARAIVREEGSIKIGFLRFRPVKGGSKRNCWGGGRTQYNDGR